MKISRIFFFNFFRKMFVELFCNILFIKKINFEMFFRRVIVQNFYFFRKYVSCKFYAFPEKTFGKTNS